MLSDQFMLNKTIKSSLFIIIIEPKQEEIANYIIRTSI